MRFFQANFRKISIFSSNFDFPGKNWPFTATSVQIILLILKSHPFRTYFLYMIRYNNISRPVHDPPAQNLGDRDPNPRDWRPWHYWATKIKRYNQGQGRAIIVPS